MEDNQFKYLLPIYWILLLYKFKLEIVIWVPFMETMVLRHTLISLLLPKTHLVLILLNLNLVLWPLGFLKINIIVMYLPFWLIPWTLHLIPWTLFKMIRIIIHYWEVNHFLFEINKCRTKHNNCKCCDTNWSDYFNCFDFDYSCSTKKRNKEKINENTEISLGSLIFRY